MWGLSCEFNRSKALGVVIPSDSVAFRSLPLFCSFSALTFILLQFLSSLLFSACALRPRDALSSFGSFTISVWFLGKSMNSWWSSVSFGFGTRNSTEDLKKAKIHCCVSFPMCFYYGTFSFTVGGHESTKWSWIWIEEKFFIQQVMKVKICVGSI